MEKNWKKRWMAGAMAFALCCTTLLQTGASAVSAAEVGGVSAQSETQIEVQTETQTETQTEKSEEELIEETVADPELALMVTEGEAFDIQNDFTGLKLSDGDHVELKKAAMEDGTVFDYNHAGTYKCVYLVTPASGEAYLVARNITVTPREAETDGSNGGQEQETGDDEPEADPVLPTISPEKRKQKNFPMRKQRMEAIRLTLYREMNSILNWTTRTDVTRRGRRSTFPVISRREA